MSQLQIIRPNICLWLLTMCFCTSLGQAQAEAEGDFDLDTATQNFAEFFEDGLYNQATTAATRALWLARVNFGEESIEAANAQINLADAQNRSGEYAGAINNYTQSIRRIEAVEGLVSPRLIRPLDGLGSANNALGLYDKGLAAYQRALRLNHVELGLYNEEQIPLRDNLSTTFMALGEEDKSEFEIEVQTRIMHHEHGNNIEKMLPPMFKLAEWYSRNNQPEKEAYQYQLAARLVRTQGNKDSPDQIEALRRLADVYRKMNMPNESMRLLKRSYRLNAEQAEPDALLGADIQVQIGDYYNLYGSSKDARRYYLLAWEELNELGNQEELIAKYFGAPVALEGPALPEIYPSNASTTDRFMRDPGQFSAGYVTARFDVEPDGDVSNVRVIESDPGNMLDKRVRIILARQQYRPRIVDGEVMETTGETVRHEFRYEARRRGDKDNKRPERLARPGSL